MEQRKARLRPPKDFLRRKAEVSMSTSELSRRAELSLNTVKAYLKGTAVRETTVQKLNEALSSYERETIVDQSTQSLQTAHFAIQVSARSLGDQSASLAVQLVARLEAAVQKTIEEGGSMDPSARTQIKLQLLKAQALLAGLD